MAEQGKPIEISVADVLTIRADDESPRDSRRLGYNEDRHADWSGLTVMVGLLELGWRHVAERFEQAAAVVPRDPLEGREIRRPRALSTVRDDGSPLS